MFPPTFRQHHDAIIKELKLMQLKMELKYSKFS